MAADFKKWKHDPRLKSMNPERLSMLLEMAEVLASAPTSRKMTEFLRINQDASKKGIRFTPTEQEILISVLTEDMSPEEKAKVEMIRKLASRMH